MATHSIILAGEVSFIPCTPNPTSSQNSELGKDLAGRADTEALEAGIETFSIHTPHLYLPEMPWDPLPRGEAGAKPGMLLVNLVDPTRRERLKQIPHLTRCGGNLKNIIGSYTHTPYLPKLAA